MSVTKQNAARVSVYLDRKIRSWMLLETGGTGTTLLTSRLSSSSVDPLPCLGLGNRNGCHVKDSMSAKDPRFLAY